MVGVVGVEGLARDGELAVHDHVVGDVIDVGVAGDVLLFLVMNLQLAEQPRRNLELVRIEMLVAHDQYMMFGAGLVPRGAGFAIDRSPEIDAGDFGAGVSRERRNAEGRHGKSSHTVFVEGTLSPEVARVKEPRGRAAGFVPPMKRVMLGLAVVPSA